MGRWSKLEERGGARVTKTKSSITLEPSPNLFELDDQFPNDLVLGNLSEEEKEGYIGVSGVVDTGAEDHAIPKQLLKWIPIEESDLSRHKRIFRGANNSKTPALGRRVFTAITREGHKRKIGCEVCPVKRLLLSGTRMARAGNKCHFEDKVADLENVKTKQNTYLRRDRNVWVLHIWVRKPNAAGFTRQGR